MRKSFIIAAVALALSATAGAQDKVDRVYGPQKGSWSIGVGLDPVSHYLGNMFNGSRDNELKDLNGEPLSYDKEKITPLASIMGKYMLTDKFGIKVNIGMRFRSDNERAYVEDQKATMNDPFSQDKVIDKHTTKINGASFAIGVEQRLTSNKHRLQAYVDGGIVWAFETESHSYSYGNEITELNQRPFTSTNDYKTMSSAMPNCRLVSDNVGKTKYHNLGVFGTIGIEYFLTQKISLGAEMNLSAVYTFRGGHSAEYEGYNVQTQRVEKYTNVAVPSSSAFEFGTKNLGANLTMNFYF